MPPDPLLTPAVVTSVGEAILDPVHPGCYDDNDLHPEHPIRVYRSIGELPLRDPGQDYFSRRWSTEPARSLHCFAQVGSRRYVGVNPRTDFVRQQKTWLELEWATSTIESMKCYRRRQVL